MSDLLDRPILRLRTQALLAGQRAVLTGVALTGDPLARLLLGLPDTDPYPLYEELRSRGPVSRSWLGPYVLTSHALCDQVLRSPDFGIRAADGSPVGMSALEAAVTGPLADSFVDLDPPQHTRLRRIAAPAFRPRVVRGWAATLEGVLHDLLDRLERRPQADLTRDLAAPFPITVIAKVLGIPDVDIDHFTRIGALVGASLDGISNVRQARALLRARADLDALFLRLVGERQAEPRDDVLSLLARSHQEGSLTTRDLTATCRLLLIAGFETTVNLIGNAVGALHADPDRWAELVADPGLAAAVVEETLRWDPSVQGTVRIAHRDIEIGGRPLPAGAEVIVFTAAGNRDPQAYADPARFDPHRTGESEHLTFSSGIHYCLGAPLARLEGEIALRGLAQRLPRLRLLPGARRRPGRTIRGFATLPVATGF